MCFPLCLYVFLYLSTYSVSYITPLFHLQLEYGTDRLEIHADALKKEDKVVIIDDLLATGGTAEAAGKLVELAGATGTKHVHTNNTTSVCHDY